MLLPTVEQVNLKCNLISRMVQIREIVLHWQQQLVFNFHEIKLSLDWK